LAGSRGLLAVLFKASSNDLRAENTRVLRVVVVVVVTAIVVVVVVASAVVVVVVVVAHVLLPLFNWLPP